MIGRVGIAINEQVNPFALRRNLEFGVAFDVLEIRPDESFGHVPFPQLVGFGGGRRIGLQVKLFVRTNEKKVKILLGPARTNLSAVAGRHIAQWAAFGDDAFDLLPLLRLRVGGQREVGRGVEALDRL